MPWAPTGGRRYSWAPPLEATERPRAWCVDAWCSAPRREASRELVAHAVPHAWADSPSSPRRSPASLASRANHDPVRGTTRRHGHPPAPPRSVRGSDAGTRDGARVVHGCDPEPRGVKVPHRQTPPARGVDDDHSDRPKHHRRPGTGPRHDQVTEGDATATWEGLVRDHTRAGCSAGPR